MRAAEKVLAIAASAALLIPICGFGPDAAKNSIPDIGADIIVTAAPAYQPLAALRGQERFPRGAQLLLVHDGKAQPLVTGFAASADANVSFDAKRVLFAGKQAATDPWQIWELTLADGSLRKLIAGASDAIRPLYLPAGRVVYAQRTALGFQLEAAGKDGLAVSAPVDSAAGSAVLPLTYMPASAIPADVLEDGRILFEAGFPLGSDRPRSCFWCTQTALGLSLTAAIMALHAGAESSWPRAMWCLRTELRWRGLRRLWQPRRTLLRRAPSTQVRLPRQPRAPGW